jgi:hypothetical protein
MEDLNTIIIPTRFKSKISHVESFPIGAKKISEALSDVPQILNLVLHFNSKRWQQVRPGHHACIRALYSSRYADMADRFQDSTGIPLFSEWQVQVFPVPRTLRHRIQQHIIEFALPQMNKWLHEHALVYQQGSGMLTFSYDEEKEEFASEIDIHAEPKRA